MRDNGENKKAISTFILKISRKLRDCNLSGLAKRKVTCVTLGYFFFVCVCAWADFMGKIESHARLTRSKQRQQVE